jgi:hypothetical protein
MLITQHPILVLPAGFCLTNQLTQVVESTYNRRVLRHAYHATALGEFLLPSPLEPTGSTEMFPCCDCS